MIGKTVSHYRVLSRLGGGGMGVVFKARRSDAVRELEKAVTMRFNDPNVLYNAACTYGIMSMKKEAIEMLKKAKASGYANMEWANRDPDLTCVRDEPEFQQLFAAR